MNINITNWPYFAFILILLLIAGTGAFLHIVPSDTFVSLLLVAIGLIAPSPLLHSTVTAVPTVTPDSQHVG